MDAVLGDCTAYLALSVPDPGATPEGRTDEGLCLDLRRRTAPSRAAATQIGIDVREVRQTGPTATSRMSVRRADGEQEVTLTMRRRGDGWAVLRTPEVCAAVGCG